MKHDHKAIERNGRTSGTDARLCSKNDYSLPKYYALIEFLILPAGLHIGIPAPIRRWTLSRVKEDAGLYVFSHRMGLFGLPTENYAIKTKQAAIVTERNIATFLRQIKSLSFVDWSREINTADPSYYK